MEENIKEKLDEVISESLDDLHDASEETYSKRVADIAKLYSLRIEEEKLLAAAESQAMSRGAESEKMLHDELLKRQETKQSILRTIGDVVKVGVTVVANGLWLRQIMKFEETGAITTKGFQLFGKPKIF